MSDNMGEIVLYKSEDGNIKIEVLFQDETIWIPLNKIAELFFSSKQNISYHLQNIYNELELDRNSTVKEYLTIQNEGGRDIKRKIEYYNLDAIIAVGYRVNSKQATQFRIWATKVLKQYILNGFSINPARIEKNYQLFLQTVEDIKNLSNNNQNINTDDILELIKIFAGTWFSLDAYDKGTIPTSGYTNGNIKIEAKELYKDISKLKNDLISKNEATDLFAQEKLSGSLEGILGNIFQTSFGEDVYPTIEEKASHLLYFIIKNHPFIDGNKRCGAFSFIWFLQKNGFNFQKKITPESLTAITLLISESNPQNIKKMIGIVILMLKGE